MTVLTTTLNGRVANHEFGHLLLALYEHRRVIWCNGRRHSLDDSDGETSYFVDDASTVQLARIALAGELYEPDSQSPPDRAYVKHLWAAAGSPPGWVADRIEETLAILRRDDVRGLALALWPVYRDNDFVILGPAAERVGQEHLA